MSGLIRVLFVLICLQFSQHGFAELTTGEFESSGEHSSFTKPSEENRASVLFLYENGEAVCYSKASRENTPDFIEISGINESTRKALAEEGIPLCNSTQQAMVDKNAQLVKTGGVQVAALPGLIIVGGAVVCFGAGAKLGYAGYEAIDHGIYSYQAQAPGITGGIMAVGGVGLQSLGMLSEELGLGRTIFPRSASLTGVVSFACGIPAATGAMIGIGYGWFIDED